MMAPSLVGWSYQKLLRPVFFNIDAEKIHNHLQKFGGFLGHHEPAYLLTEKLFCYSHQSLGQKVDGILFPNPVGLAAGFDYDGHLAKTAKAVGFGFNTVGTVTAKPYGGNPGLRLGRLPKSQALFVNKGFKSQGIMAVAKRLAEMNLAGHVVGVSIGSSNLPEIDTIPKAIADYAFSFDYLKNKKFIRYFELNISCPNLAISGAFINLGNFQKLLAAVEKINLSVPVYVKMPNEITPQLSDALVRLALRHGMAGFIFSNLVKNRKNIYLNRQELKKFANLPGNFSGRPTFKNSNKLIAHTRKKFGKNFTIIGCGGIFDAADAKAKLAAGANLVQLITGMVFEGPQSIGQINRELAKPKDSRLQV